MHRGGDLRETVRAYFDDCDATMERFETRSGSISVRQIPYTLAGLAEATGLDKQTICRMAEPESTSRYRGVMQEALRRIERYIVERALMGEVQLSIAQLLLGEMGVGTREVEQGTVTVLLEDAEGLAQ